MSSMKSMSSMSSTGAFKKPGAMRNGNPILVTVEEPEEESERGFSRSGSLMEENDFSQQEYFFEEDEEVEKNWKLGWAKTEADGTLLGRSAHWGWELKDVRFQQETPREQQDMTRSWDAVEIPRGRGGGLEMSRSKESDTNEYGFGRGFKEIVREISARLMRMAGADARGANLAAQIRELNAREDDASKIPEMLAKLLQDSIGAKVTVAECEDMMKRLSMHTNALLQLELIIEGISRQRAGARLYEAHSIAEDVDEEPMMLNQAALRMKQGHSHDICCLAMAPDGSLLASADAGGYIFLWDLKDGDQIQFKAHEGPVKCLAFTDSKEKNGADILFSVGSDRCIRAFDAHTGEETMCIKDAHDDDIEGLGVVSAAAQMCVTCGFDRTCKVWGLGTPENMLDEIELEHSADAQLRESSGSTGMTGTEAGSVASGTSASGSGSNHEAASQGFQPLAETERTKYLPKAAASYLSRNPEIGQLGPDEIDALSYGMIPKYFKAGDRVYAEAASSDLGFFYVLYSGRAFKSEGHFDIINGQKVTGYLEAGEVFGENESLSYGNAREHSVTCSVDCLVLACPRELYYKVKEDEDWVDHLANYYADACKPLWREKVKKGVGGVEETKAALEIPKELLRDGEEADADADGAAAAAAAAAGHAAKTSTETQKDSAIDDMSLLKRGKTVLMGGASFKVIKIKRMREQLKRRAFLRRLDEMKRACAFFSRSIMMPGGTWRLANTLRGHRDMVTCVATDAEGRVVSGGHDCTVRIWAGTGGPGLQGYLTSSVCVATMSGHNNWVTCVAFAEGDRVVVSGGEDSTVMLWCADRGREGQPLRKFEASSGWVQSVAQMGSAIVTVGGGGGGGWIRVWDLTTGRITLIRKRQRGKYQQLRGLAGCGNGCLSAFGDGRSIWLVDATQSQGIGGMSVPEIEVARNGDGFDHDDEEEEEEEPRVPPNTAYLEDMQNSLHDVHVPIVTLLKGEPGANAHVEHDAAVDSKLEAQMEELRQDAQRLRDLSASKVGEFMNRTYRDTKSIDTSGDDFQLHHSDPRSAWIASSMCDVYQEKVIDSGMLVRSSMGLFGVVGERADEVKSFSDERHIAVCKEDMIRGRYSWDVVLKGNEGLGFSKELRIGIVSTTMTYGELVELGDIEGVTDKGGKTFMLTSRLGRVTGPLDIVEVDAASDVWAVIPRRAEGEENEREQGDKEVDASKAREGNRDKEKGAELEGDEDEQVKQVGVRSIRIKELGMEGDKIQMGFSTITRIFWIKSIPKGSTPSLLKLEIPESYIPSLDHRSGLDCRIFPVIQLKGVAWHLVLRTPEHNIGIRESVRQYGALLEAAFSESDISQQEVVPFKGKTVVLDCQPWLPQGQGLVNGRSVIMHVPRGAIASAIKFTITACNPPRGSDEFVQSKITTGRDKFEHGRLVGVVVDIQPHGLSFDRPVTLTIPHACVLESEKDKWDDNTEVLFLRDFFTVRKLPTSVFGTFEGAVPVECTSHNVVLQIRETGVYGIKGSHTVREMMDITMACEHDDSPIAMGDVSDDFFIRDEPFHHAQHASPLRRASVAVHNVILLRRTSSAFSTAMSGSLKNLMAWKETPNKPGKSSSPSPLRKSVSRDRLTAKSPKKSSTKSLNMSQTASVSAPPVDSSLTPVRRAPHLSRTPSDDSRVMPFPLQRKESAILQRTSSFVKRSNSTLSQDSYADLNMTTAWTRAPSFNARASSLSRRGRSSKNLLAKADNSSGVKPSWMQAFPETYADEDEQLFKLIMCSPLTSNSIFRGYTGDGRFSLPYSSIITKISTVQDRIILGATLTLEPLPNAYLHRDLHILTEWRGSPVAIPMRMFANRLSDPAMHTVLDEGDNVEQHLGLTLSLKGYVGSEYRDQVEKEGGYNEERMMTMRRTPAMKLCTVGPYKACVARLDPRFKTDRGARRLQNTRFLAHGRKASINYGQNINVPGWDVIIIGESGNNKVADMLRSVQDNLQRRGWTVRVGDPLWQAGEEGEEMNSKGRVTDMQMQRAQLIASTCKASIVFLSPGFYEKADSPSTEMCLIRAVLKHQGETEGNKIIPVLLPPFSIMLNNSVVGRRASLIEMDYRDPFPGQYGSRLKQCYRNAVVAGGDTSNLDNKIHSKLMLLIKEGPYGTPEARREFFSPSKSESRALSSTEREADFEDLHIMTRVKSDDGTVASHEEDGQEGEGAEVEKIDPVADYLASISVASHASNAELAEMPLDDYIKNLVFGEQELWSELADEFGVEATADDVEEMKSIADLAIFIKTQAPRLGGL